MWYALVHILDAHLHFFPPERHNSVINAAKKCTLCTKNATTSRIWLFVATHILNSGNMVIPETCKLLTNWEKCWSQRRIRAKLRKFSAKKIPNRNWKTSQKKSAQKTHKKNAFASPLPPAFPKVSPPTLIGPSSLPGRDGGFCRRLFKTWKSPCCNTWSSGNISRASRTWASALDPGASLWYWEIQKQMFGAYQKPTDGNLQWLNWIANGSNVN